MVIFRWIILIYTRLTTGLNAKTRKPKGLLVRTLLLSALNSVNSFRTRPYVRKLFDYYFRLDRDFRAHGRGNNAPFGQFRYLIYSSRYFWVERERQFFEYWQRTDRVGRPVVGAYRTASGGWARQIEPNRAEQRRVMTCVMNMGGRIRSVRCGVGRVVTTRGVVHSIRNPILADEKKTLTVRSSNRTCRYSRFLFV